MTLISSPSNHMKRGKNRVTISQNLPDIEERPRDLSNELISKFDSGMTVDPLALDMQFDRFTSSSGEVLEGYHLAGAAD